MNMKEIDKISSLHNQLLNSNTYSFPSSRKVDVSLWQGVYIIYNKKGKILHVGRTRGGEDGLNQRLYNHLTNNSSFSKNYLRAHQIKLRQIGRFKYIKVDNARVRALLEALTTGKLCPVHLGTGKKGLTENIPSKPSSPTRDT